MRGVVYGLGAAVSFGVSAPLATRLLGHADPQALTGLLYAGAALALAPYARSPAVRSTAVALPRIEVPRLVVVVLSGGVVAPVLLMLGLRRVGGLTGSLLLNTEALLTIVFALVLFGERLSRRTMLAAALTIGAAAVLATDAHGASAHVSGVLFVLGACAGWALDNNLTARLAAWDPGRLVLIKAVTSALVNTTIALLRGARFPSGGLIVAALGLGAVSYGASVLLDAYALRELGAAREAALFAVAPFAGAALAPFVTSSRFDNPTTIATMIMVVGVGLLFLPERARAHSHEAIEHDHPHEHDEHHHHDHQPTDPAETRHSHPHRHEPLAHAHPYRTDGHH